MNEEELKNHLISKYEKELQIVVDDTSALRRSSLQKIAEMINFVFDSKGERAPEDVTIHLNLPTDADDNSNSDVSYQETDFEKAIRESQEEYNTQNGQSQQNPSSFSLDQPPSFNLDNIRYLFTDEEAAREKQMTIDQLKKYRRELVQNLNNYDSINGARYKELIIEESKKIGTEIKDGIFIAILLHTGERISKLFSNEENGSSMYYWVASNDKMIKDKIKPRHFVIVKNTGEEINPEIPIGQQINDKQILLNVRLI